ncbi:MAG: hypothetical protein E7212_02955 [Clostridium sartagoforme]|nr:hypothetical protein [Clostridium sartagoforme]
MVEILSKVSTISFILATVFFLLSIFIWFRFGILNIIGDLSGRTAKKSIAKMREKNQKTGIKHFKPSFVNIERGKLTDSIQDSKKLKKNKVKKTEELIETVLIEGNKVNNLYENVTELLWDENSTSILNEKEINEVEGNTTVLLNESVVNKENNIENTFTIIDEVVIIHTDEVIR